MEWDERSHQQMDWNGEISHLEEKQRIAELLAAKVKDGQVIGFGSGSSALVAARAIAARVKAEGLHIRAIPTSQEMEMHCVSLGIPVTSLLKEKPDWGFDGADEVDPHGWLIKGRGGAMYREKLTMSCAAKTYILVDRSKLVEKLGTKFMVPVEVQYDAVTHVREALFAMGATDVVLRLAKAKDGPCITEHGHFILDTKFETITEDLEKRLKQIVGVIETGLFIGYPCEIICSDGGVK